MEKFSSNLRADQKKVLDKMLCEELKRKCFKLEEEIGDQQKENQELQQAYQLLERHHEERVSFYSSMGAVLGSMVWSISSTSGTAESLVKGESVNNYFRITKEVLQSFVQTYKGAMPDCSSDLAQFPLSLCGTIVNMTFSNECVRKLVENHYFLNFADTAVDLLPQIPAAGDRLTTVLLLILNNLGRNGGLKVLQKRTIALLNLLVSLVKRKVHTSEDLPRATLRILELYTTNIKSVEEFTLLQNSLTCKDVLFWRQSKSEVVRACASSIIYGLNAARVKYEGPFHSEENI